VSSRIGSTGNLTGFAGGLYLPEYAANGDLVLSRIGAIGCSWATGASSQWIHLREASLMSRPGMVVSISRWIALRPS